MIPIESVIAFFIASVLLAIAPGPDNIFVLTQSTIHGRKAGIYVTAGLCTGLIVHTTGVALGIAAVIKTSYIAFTALKIIGAMYLLYLAWQAFLASAKGTPESTSKVMNGMQLYRRGIVMNVTNPKVSMFFLAFLPQFANPGYGSIAMQIFFLGALFILATLIVFCSIAMLAGTLGPWLVRSPKAQIIMNRTAGAIFLGLALKLATSEHSS
jgi:threonine/homoserine/homoserine lactone efflux protein